MKNIIFIVLVFLIVASISCKKGQKTKVEIEKSMAEKIDLPDKVKISHDLKRIRDAIIVHQTLNDKFPSSIEELDLELFLSDEYIYDADKGIVKSKSYPDF